MAPKPPNINVLEYQPGKGLVRPWADVLKDRNAASSSTQRTGTQVPVGGVSVAGRPVMSPHPYILELYKGDGESPISSITLPFVSNVSLQKAPATSSNFTLTGHHAQYSGYRVVGVNLSGNSGYRELDIVRFNKLRNFLSEVETLRADNENAFYYGDEYKLVLNFPWEMERHYCMVRAFNVQRAAGQTTFSYSYSLSLSTYGVAHRKWAFPTNLSRNVVQSTAPSGHEMARMKRLFETTPGASQVQSGYVPWGENIQHYGPWLEVYGPFVTEEAASEGPWLQVVTEPSVTIVTVDGDQFTVTNGALFYAGQVVVLFRKSLSGDTSVLQGRVVKSVAGNVVTLTSTFPSTNYPLDGKSWVGPAVRAPADSTGGDDAGGISLSPAGYDISKDDFAAAGIEVAGGAFSARDVANYRAFGAAVSASPIGRTIASSGTSSPLVGAGGGQSGSAYQGLLGVISSAETAWSSMWLDYVSKPLAEANRLRNTIVPALNLYRRTATVARTTIGRYYRALPEWKTYAAWVRADFNASTQLWRDSIREVREMSALSFWRSQFGPADPVRTIPVVVSNSNTPVIAVPVESGDRSAFDVADRVSGSRSTWEAVRDANQLRDPFSYADGSPLRPGDTILVPAPEAVVSTDQGELFGTDLAVENGDLVLDSGGKLSLVSGASAVLQSVRHRLRTVRGTNKAFPAFGLAKSLDEKQTSTLYGQLWSDMHAQLLRDRRISKVTKLVLNEGPGDYKADVEYELVSLGKQRTTTTYAVNT